MGQAIGHLVGIEADQGHQGDVAEQQRRQGVRRLDAVKRLEIVTLGGLPGQSPNGSSLHYLLPLRTLRNKTGTDAAQKCSRQPGDAGLARLRVDGGLQSAERYTRLIR